MQQVEQMKRHQDIIIRWFETKVFDAFPSDGSRCGSQSWFESCWIELAPLRWRSGPITQEILLRIISGQFIPFSDSHYWNVFSSPGWLTKISAIIARRVLPPPQPKLSHTENLSPMLSFMSSLPTTPPSWSAARIKFILKRRVNSEPYLICQFWSTTAFSKNAYICDKTAKSVKILHFLI